MGADRGGDHTLYLGSGGDSVRTGLFKKVHLKDGFSRRQKEGKSHQKEEFAHAPRVRMGAWRFVAVPVGAWEQGERGGKFGKVDIGHPGRDLDAVLRNLVLILSQRGTGV